MIKQIEFVLKNPNKRREGNQQRKYRNEIESGHSFADVKQTKGAHDGVR